MQVRSEANSRFCISYRYSVLIKGTDVYDSGRGQFVDLSVLDVLQIFGRAGRPGMESSGVGYICTPDEKLDHYLNAVTSQVSTVRLRPPAGSDTRASIL